MGVGLRFEIFEKSIRDGCKMERRGAESGWWDVHYSVDLYGFYSHWSIRVKIILRGKKSNIEMSETITKVSGWNVCSVFGVLEVGLIYRGLVNIYSHNSPLEEKYYLRMDLIERHFFISVLEMFFFEWKRYVCSFRFRDNGWQNLRMAKLMMALRLWIYRIIRMSEIMMSRQINQNK